MSVVIDPIPRVTVIIPVFNCAATLLRAVASATAQTLSNIEVILIDNKSIDGSLEVARLAERQDKRITVIAMEKNEGRATVMNRAATIARGDWLTVLDAGDMYVSDRLAVMVATGENKAVDLVLDNQFYIDNANGRVVNRAFNALGAGREVGLLDFVERFRRPASFDFAALKTIIRTQFVRQSGLIYEESAKPTEDLCYLASFFNKGGRAWIVYRPLYIWILPFSPSSRRWTDNSGGQLLANLDPLESSEFRASLRQREREYRMMIHYFDAKWILAERGSRWRAASIIIGEPRTWSLLTRNLLETITRWFAP